MCSSDLCDELDWLVSLELAGTNLGALQVGEDADGFALLFRDGADHADELGLLGVGSVGKVEAGYVQAGANQFAEDLDGATGRAEGADDLGATCALRCSRRGIVQKSIHEVACRYLSHHRGFESDGMTVSLGAVGNFTREHARLALKRLNESELWKKSGRCTRG